MANEFFQGVGPIDLVVRADTERVVVVHAALRLSPAGIAVAVVTSRPVGAVTLVHGTFACWRGQRLDQAPRLRPGRPPGGRWQWRTSDRSRHEVALDIGADRIGRDTPAPPDVEA